MNLLSNDCVLVATSLTQQCPLCTMHSCFGMNSRVKNLMAWDVFCTMIVYNFSYSLEELVSLVPVKFCIQLFSTNYYAQTPSWWSWIEVAGIYAYPNLVQVVEDLEWYSKNVSIYSNRLHKLTILLPLGWMQHMIVHVDSSIMCIRPPQGARHPELVSNTSCWSCFIIMFDAIKFKRIPQPYSQISSQQIALTQ